MTTNNPLSGHTDGTNDGLKDGDHILSPSLTNLYEGVHGNGILLPNDTAYGDSDRNDPPDLPGAISAGSAANQFIVKACNVILDGVVYAIGGGSNITVTLTSTTSEKLGSFTALSTNQECIFVVIATAEGLKVTQTTPIGTASGAYASITGSATSYLKTGGGAGANRQSIVLGTVRATRVTGSTVGDLNIQSLSEYNDKRVFVRPSPLYLSPVTTGAVGATAELDDHTALAQIHGTGQHGALGANGVIWQSYGSQLGSTTAGDNDKDVVYYSGTHAARFTRSVFDRVLTSTAASLTLTSTDANILILTPGSNANIITSGTFPAGYVIHIRNLHASNYVRFALTSSSSSTMVTYYEIAAATCASFVCTVSHASYPTFSLLMDDTIDTPQLAANAVTLDKMAGIPRGKIIVGDASGDPSHLAAGANGKLLVADANGDPSWTTVSGDVTISAGAVTIGNDKIDSQHYVDGSIDTAHVGNDQITYAKIQDVSATNKILGRDSSGAGVIEEIAPADVRTMLNVADGATAYTDADAIAAVEGESTLVLQSGTTIGTDLKLTTSSDDAIIENVTSDKDIIFKANDGGTPTEIMRVDGSTSRVGIGTAAPSTKLHVKGTDAVFTIEDTSIGIAALTNAMSGINVVSAGMNAGASKFGSAVKFLSTDPQLTTENPKFLAALVPRATETYDHDIDGGMALDFAITDNAQGATNVPVVKMTIDHTGFVGIGTDSPDANLHVVGAGSGDHLILEGTLGSAITSAPNMVLFRNGDDAAADIDDNDLIGQIVFRGENDASTPQEVNYATIEGGMDDTSDGSEDGHITFNLIEAGTLTEFMRLRATTRDVVVNDQGDDIDFRVEGDTDSNLLFTDASTDMVGIGTSSPAGKLHVKTSSVNYAALFESNDDGASAAPDVALYRNSATPANGDDLGHLIWRGVTTDNAGSPTLTRGNYADIFCEAQAVTTGADSGKMHLRTKKAGTMNKVISLTANEVVINESGNASNIDIDLRVESTGNDNMLFVDSANDEVGIGTNSPEATLDILSGGTFRNTRLLTVSVSGSTTLTEAAHAGRYNICAGNITLPSTSTAGEHYAILNTTGGDITIGRNGNNINGAGSDATLGTFKAATCIAIGSNNWMVIGV
jgi:hypothetical protein